MLSRCAVVSPEANAPISIETFDLAPPAPDTIIVKVEYAGICGSDPHMWKGDLPLPAPILLGHEGIGTVHELHPTVSLDHASRPLSVGDRVYWSAIRPCHSCYYCTIAGDESGCPNSSFMSKYEDVVKNKGTWATYTEYATLGPRNAFFKVETDAPSEAFIALGCGLPAVMQAVDHLPNHAIENGENVVVQGAGAVGLSAIMLARIAGASKIVCIEANKFRMAKAKEFGADECLDVTETTQQERAERLKQIFGPRGSTLAVECTGTLKAVSEGLSFLSRKGKYILIGTWAGKGEVPFDPFLAVHKAITIQGSTYSSPRIYHNALRLVEQNYGRFPLASCVTHKFSLNKSQEGLETVLKGEVVKGVIQLSLRD